MTLSTYRLYEFVVWTPSRCGSLHPAATCHQIVEASGACGGFIPAQPQEERGCEQMSGDKTWLTLRVPVHPKGGGWDWGQGLSAHLSSSISSRTSACAQCCVAVQQGNRFFLDSFATKKQAVAWNVIRRVSITRRNTQNLNIMIKNYSYV